MLALSLWDRTHEELNCHSLVLSVAHRASSNLGRRSIGRRLILRGVPRSGNLTQPCSALSHLVWLSGGRTSDEREGPSHPCRRLMLVGCRTDGRMDGGGGRAHIDRLDVSRLPAGRPCSSTTTTNRPQRIVDRRPPVIQNTPAAAPCVVVTSTTAHCARACV